MAGFNRVIIMGNLTKDPELRYTPSGTAVTDLRLAVTTKRRAGDETLFIDVTAWERQAETCCEYLSKGKAVLVEGRLKMDEWNDRESGQKRSKVPRRWW
ncbi:MAG: single-stranded DNA-binding protein [Planctomycetota bacterium]|jgi:single-strand DNA-binding protein